ncbi:MAG: DNRLRE domain-containing protein, partial [Clostridia bacterium]|nr:DNRLRE domain-containing protein [Clostridia bacterium]
SDQVWVCNNSSNGKRYGYMRVVDLPKIDANHFITGAFLNLKNYSAPSAEVPLMCSEVLGDWDAATLTFATQPDVNPLYQDYCKFPASKYTWQQLDVTTLARKWYLGNNKGVILTPRTDSYSAIRIQSSDGSAKPYFTVNYASLAGLEGYLTYDSQSAGLAGSGAVSLVNGNMIFMHGDTAMNGSRMPVSVTHYYNSCNSDVDEFGLGCGWRTSVHQTLHKEYINEDIVYVYTDGDGTEHWFEADEDDSTQYVDMSGLSLTLTVGDDGKITITSKGDGRMVFPAISATPTADVPVTAKVLIETIHDAAGNQVTVTPRTDEPLYVASVEDGAGRVTTFTYAAQTDGSVKCTAIKTPWQTDAACTRFTYADGCLTAITHEDNRISTYHYETRNGCHLLDQAQGADGLAVRYEYSNTGAVYGLPHCVTRAETGEAAILSADADVKNAALYATKVTYNYGNHLTLVTDNLSDKTLRYHFNDNGNQTSIDDGLGYAVYTAYDQQGDNADAPINHATTRSRMQRSVKNLLLDPMMEENSSAWERSSTGTFLRTETTNQWGLVSYRIDVPANGEAYVRQAVTLQPGSSYTLSAYMKSAAPRALVRAACTVNGETRYFASDPVPVDANAANADFRRVAVSFTLPAEADAAVYCEAIGMTGSGYFWVDCMQLEEGLTCNHFNLLQNCDFTRQTSSSAAPTGWTIGDGDHSYITIEDLSVADDIDEKLAPEFLRSSRAARLKGRFDRTVTMNQDVRFYGKKGDRFTAGGWCKSFAKKVDVAGYVFCSLSVYFNSGDSWNSGGHVHFNYGEDGWQFASGSIVAP